MFYTLEIDRRQKWDEELLTDPLKNVEFSSILMANFSFRFSVSLSLPGNESVAMIGEEFRG